MEEYHGKPVEYWKKNAEEDYIKTPLSVLKYITVLEEQAKALLLGAVSGRSEQLAAYLQDVIGKKYSIYFEQQDIDGLIEAANCH